MSYLFYITALISLIASIKVITTRNVLHASLFCTILLLSVSSLCFSFHADIVFASLFLCYSLIVTLLHFTLIRKLALPRTVTGRISPKIWLTPTVISYFLLFLLVYLILAEQTEVPVSELSIAKYDSISSSTLLFLCIIIIFFILESIMVAFFLISHKAKPDLEKTVLKSSASNLSKQGDFQ